MRDTYQYDVTLREESSIQAVATEQVVTVFSRTPFLAAHAAEAQCPGWICQKVTLSVVGRCVRCQAVLFSRQDLRRRYKPPDNLCDDCG